MTIKYLDSKRVSALSSDGEGLSFSDNFSTDNWTTSLSSVIGVSGEVLNWNVPSGSVQEQQSYVDMLSALVNTTKWTLRFKLTVSGFTQGSSTQTQQLFFGISNESSSGHTNTQDIIGLKLTLTNTIKTIGVQMRNATPSNTGNTSNVSTALSAGTWYVEINRIDLTNAKITLYSDSSYLTSVSTATETYSANVLNDLRYLKCSEYSNNAGTNHTLSGTIDDVSFYNGSMSKPTNVENNSILVEKDTGKRFWFDTDAVTTSTGTFTWDGKVTSADNNNQGFYVANTSSVVYGKKIESVSFWLKKVGSPTGTAYCRVWGNSGSGTTVTQLHEFGSIDSSTLASSYTKYTFDTGSYTLAVGDTVGIAFTGSSASTDLVGQLGNLSVGFDSGNTYRGRKTTSTWSPVSAHNIKFEVIYPTWIEET